VVVVDVVVVDVLRGLLGRHRNPVGPCVRVEEGPAAAADGRRGDVRPIRGARARRVPDDARRLAAGRLQDARQVLIQDGLRVLLALAAGREQRVMEGGAAGEVNAILTLLLLDGQRKDRVHPHDQ